MEPLRDSALVAACLAGEQAAWNELVERFSRYVFAIATQAFRLTETDAEDVFQDVFARVYERLDTLRDAEALRPWIAQLTRRECIDRLRKATRETPVEELPEGIESAIDSVEDAFDVRAELAMLSEECQAVLDRFFCQDESYRTIGVALDLPPGTIASRISRCLARLRERLEGRNLTAAASSSRRDR